MNWSRLWRHAITGGSAFRQAFSPEVIQDITNAVAASEVRHCGELRFVIERALPLPALLAGQSARARALELFSFHRVWDTEQNSGVLIYVLFAERQVEIVADRGIQARVPSGTWDHIVGQMTSDYAAGRFGAGSVAGVRAVGDLIAAAWPVGQNDSNELPNAPLLLG